MRLGPGDRVGVFEISGALGAGGMGEVYRARDTRLGRDVALKALPRSVSQDPERLARFEREAQLLARLNHPGIGAIYGVEDSPHGPLLVLELVPGETLEDLLRKGRLPLAQAMSIGRKVADAVAFAHDSGIVHRDLKPANIKCTPQGGIKVLDFGVAKALAPQAVGTNAEAPTLVGGITVDGDMLGTPAYMSPEQTRAKDVDRRSDIWSFGCILHEMLTGQRLFQRQTVTDTLVAILGEDPDWSALPASTPPAIRALLRRCLQRDRDRRVHDMADVRVELDEALESPAEAATVATASVQQRHKDAAGARLEIAMVALLVLAVVVRIMVQARLLLPLTDSIYGFALAYPRPVGMYFYTFAILEPALIGLAVSSWIVTLIARPAWRARARTGLVTLAIVMTASTIGGLYLIAGQAVMHVMRISDARGNALVERDIVSLHLAAGNARQVIAILDPQHTRDHPADDSAWEVPGAAFQLAEAYRQTGDLDAARRLYRRAEESATTFDEVLSDEYQRTKTRWRTQYGLDVLWQLSVRQLREFPALIRAVSAQRLKQLDSVAGNAR